jgi:hypothetical protein
MIEQSSAQGTLPADARPALIAGRSGAEPIAKARSGMGGAVPTAAAPDAISPIAAQVATTQEAAVIAPLPDSGADIRATAATLREYRSAIDESRDTIRAIIRLGDRQRPGNSASIEEQTAFRLRKQNVEAAKNYRSYLDTLARSMRGTPSEAVARQSLERARQTLGYVRTMLVDSEASLR